MRILVEKNKLSRNFAIFDNSAKTLVIGKNQIDYQKPIAKQICKILYTNKINSVIVEGGSRTLQHFINEDLWDEARVLIGKTTFQNGVKSPDLMTVCASEHPIKNDILKIYFND